MGLWVGTASWSRACVQTSGVGDLGTKAENLEPGQSHACLWLWEPLSRVSRTWDPQRYQGFHCALSRGRMYPSHISLPQGQPGSVPKIVLYDPFLLKFKS